MVAHFIVMIRMVHLAQPYWHCTVYSTLCTLYILLCSVNSDLCKLHSKWCIVKSAQLNFASFA